jgi:hypothetical protein
MRPRLLFLVKFLGYSLLLFTFGQQLVHGYASLLGKGMNLLNSNYHIILSEVEKFLYGSSFLIIAFFALILSTPNIPVIKKAVVILIGTISFFLTDLFFVQYVIYPQGHPVSNEDSPGFEIYLCIKWLLPFLLWIILTYQHFGGLFTPREKERSAI